MNLKRCQGTWGRLEKQERRGSNVDILDIYII